MQIVSFRTHVGSNTFSSIRIPGKMAKQNRFSPPSPRPVFFWRDLREVSFKSQFERPKMKEAKKILCHLRCLSNKERQKIENLILNSFTKFARKLLFFLLFPRNMADVWVRES